MFIGNRLHRSRIKSSLVGIAKCRSDSKEYWAWATSPAKTSPCREQLPRMRFKFGVHLLRNRSLNEHCHESPPCKYAEAASVDFLSQIRTAASLQKQSAWSAFELVLRQCWGFSKCQGADPSCVFVLLQIVGTQLILATFFHNCNTQWNLALAHVNW